MTLAQTAIRWGETVAWPDTVSSLIIDQLVGRTRRKLERTPEIDNEQFAHDMAAFPIAIETATANAQHYEIPARFFELVLGPQRKYSCCLYDNGARSLSEAEEHALAETSDHAQLRDGQDVLELGCGWGSLSLWMARNFPNSRITSVSNSHSQREYITRIASEWGLRNLSVVTADMNDFKPSSSFDRIVSIEMFEHMANWRLLLARMRDALRPEGLLFIHVFSHRSSSYRFLTDNEDDWIAQHFFTGGIMPSHQLIRQFPDIFKVEREWKWSGRNYETTARDWLRNYDQHSSELFEILTQTYGKDARLWQRRWRLFFLATMRLFAHSHGNEWGVSHYLLRPEQPK